MTRLLRLVLLLCLLNRLARSSPPPSPSLQSLATQRSVQLHARVLRKSLLRTQVEERGERSACCTSVTAASVSTQLNPKSILPFLLPTHPGGRGGNGRGQQELRQRWYVWRGGAPPASVSVWSDALASLTVSVPVSVRRISPGCGDAEGVEAPGKGNCHLLTCPSLLSSSSSKQRLATRSLATRHQPPNQRTTCGRQASASQTT